MPTNPSPDASEPRQCAECGRSFDPEHRYQEQCEECWEETDDAAPRPGESADEWMDRIGT